jgi:hypothetical protein
MKKFLIKGLILIIILSLSQLGSSMSYFSDTITASGNTLTTSSLEVGMRSGQGNFVSNPLDLEPGDSVARDIYTQKLGTLDSKYRSEYEYVSGNAELCNALQLRVWYNWYDAQPLSPGDHSTRHMDLKYSGSLSSFNDFDTSEITHDPDMQLLNTKNYYDNIFYTDNEHWFYYHLSLPSDAPSTLRGKTCTFNIRTTGWQTNLPDESSGFSDTAVLQSTVATGVWHPPAQSLVYPLDGGTAGVGSDWTNTPYMDWTDAVWGEPVTYIYESAHSDTTNSDGSFAFPVYIVPTPLTNSMIPAPGTPDGAYYWHVQTCDSMGCGDWSEIWEFTVDRTIQEANAGDIVINELMWMGSTQSTADEWVELRNMTDSPIILKNWLVEKAGTGSLPNLTIPAGYTIPANGYFLIASYSASDISSALAVEVDWVTSGVELVNDGEKLILKDAFGNTIDQTPVTDGDWAVGVNGTFKQSMERNSTPGDGINDGDWHTCINDACNDTTYWDIEGDNYGTPGAVNLSENDPTTPTGVSEDLEASPVSEFSAELKDENVSDEEVGEPVDESALGLQDTTDIPETEKQDEDNEEAVIEEFQEEDQDVSEDEPSSEPEPEESEPQPEETEIQVESETDE